MPVALCFQDEIHIRSNSDEVLDPDPRLMPSSATILSSSTPANSGRVGQVDD